MTQTVVNVTRRRPAGPGFPGGAWARPSRATFLPIPVLLGLMVVARLVFAPSVYFDPAWLIVLGNVLGVTAVSLAVCFVALRGYQATGRLQTLLLGCGVLIFGIGGALAAFVRSLPDGANLNVTLYNTGAVVGGAFHLVAAFLLLAGASPEAGSKRRGRWLLLGYVGSAAFMFVLTVASFKGAVPLFFIQSVGPTPVRQAVLGTADLLFLFSFVIFIGSYLRTREGFLYWYACALALTCISLTSFFLQHSVGSPVGWVGRVSQYVGGVYFLLSLVSAAQTAESRGTSLDHVMAGSLSGAEERFRALAENSPDAIHRFDRLLRQIYVNAAGQRLYGKPGAATRGKGLEHAGLPEAQATALIDAVKEVFDTGEAVQVEVALPGSEGSRFLESRCVGERGPRGEVANVLMLTRDVTDRKRAAETQRETRERIEAILHGIADTFYSLDREWRFTTINPAAEKAPFGRPAADLLGRIIWELYPNLVGTPIQQHYLDAARRPGIEHYVAQSPLNGRWYEVFMQGWKGGVDVYMRDVSERKRAEEALRASEEKYRHLFENMAEEVHFWRIVRNPSGDVKTWRLVDANPPTLKTWGRSSVEEIEGKTTDEIFGPGATEHFMPVVQKIMTEGVPHSFEDYFPNLDKHFRFTSVPLGDSFITTGVDITEIKRAEKDLRNSELRFRLALRNAPVSVAAQDRDLRYIWAFNQKTAKPEDLVGHFDHEIFTADEAAHFMALKRRVLDEGIEFREQRWIVRPGGSVFLDICWEPIRDEPGNVVGVASATVDLTAIKRAEEKLAEADRRKNEFLAVLSHELRNPLAPITNALYVLEHAAPGGIQAKRAKEVIDRQVGQLSHLVNDLLDVTRISRNKIQLQRARVDLCDIVRRSVEDQRSLFERGEVRLEAEIPRGPVYIHADATRIAQVVGNLLQNSAKFTRRGGTARVSVASDAVAGDALVRVSDTGVGMVPETLAGLFQPFMQADKTLERSKGGLGLGLALIKALVELHGGQVRAHSDGLGKGAEFVIRLPLDSAHAIGPVAVREAVRRPRRRVLIIEDNVDGADTLCEALTLGGDEIAVAYNGPDGVARAREFKPEVVLCDIGLPGMDGYDVARAFRADEALKDLFLVALSGYALPEDLQRAQEAGFERHLSKPPDLRALEELLAALGDRGTEPA